MSGIDEQTNLSLLRLEYSPIKMRDYEKWIYGCFECVKCKHRTYHDVPHHLRRWAKEQDVNIEVVKNKAREHIKIVYGIVDGMTDLHHRNGLCGGEVVYKNVDGLNGDLIVRDR